MEIDNIFYRDGYQLARAKLDAGPAAAAIHDIMETVYASIDGLIESFTGRCDQEGLTVDCRKGCTWCCSQAVLVSSHELMYLYNWIEKNLETPMLDRINQAAHTRNKHTEGMAAMEFLHFIHPCPLLDNGSCLAYPARPMACRIYLSASEYSCRMQYEKPDKASTMARLYEFPLRAGRLMNEGIRKALAEKGIVTSEWLMESLLDQVFTDKHILEGWIDDYKAFLIKEMSREEKLYMRNYQDRQITPPG